MTLIDGQKVPVPPSLQHCQSRRRNGLRLAVSPQYAGGIPPAAGRRYCVGQRPGRSRKGVLRLAGLRTNAVLSEKYHCIGSWDAITTSRPKSRRFTSRAGSGPMTRPLAHRVLHARARDVLDRGWSIMRYRRDERGISRPAVADACRVFSRRDSSFCSFRRTGSRQVADTVGCRLRHRVNGRIHDRRSSDLLGRVPSTPTPLFATGESMRAETGIGSAAVNTPSLDRRTG